MTYKFTNRAEKAIQIANEIAANLGHDYIGTEHLLYGLVEEGTGIASKVLQNQGMTSDKILDEIEELIGRSIRCNFWVYSTYKKSYRKCFFRS